MRAKHWIFAALCAAFTMTSSHAPQARAVQTAPRFAPEAEKLVEAMIARYAALRSYSDTTQLRLENGQAAPQAMADGLEFKASLQWQRPANIRFEGTARRGAFVAVGNAQKMLVLSPEHPGFYVSRERNPPIVLTDANGKETILPGDNAEIRLDEPLMETHVGGPGLGFLLDPRFWTRTRDDVQIMAFDPDAATGGEACRVVRVEVLFDDGGTSTMRLFIAKSDGLLRRLEQSDARMGAGVLIVETHSNVRLNPDSTASTWDFTAPAGAKAVEYFSQLNPRRLDPALKVGDLLPIHSGDDLRGQPLELNPKSGKVIVVHFFTLGSGEYDAQTLRQMDKIIGRDRLQIVAVSGAGVRERVEEFATRLKLPFPIYFDKGAMRSPLAQKFGVRGWPTTFVFGRDGKLQLVCSRTGEASFIEILQKLLPGTPDTAFFPGNDAVAAIP